MPMRSSSLANNPLAVTRELDGRYDVVLEVRDALPEIERLLSIIDEDGTVMTKEVYDTTNNGVVDNSEKLEGRTIAQIQADITDTIGASNGIASLDATTKLERAQVPTMNVTLEGDVSGSFAVDGSLNTTVNVVVQDNSHSHTFSNLTANPTTLSGYGITDAYTKTELDAVNVLRADKVLASKDVANMIYSAGNLVKIRYTADVDVDYEVLTYSGSDLVNVAHYIDSVFKGDTVLTYSGGELVSSIFVGV